MIAELATADAPACCGQQPATTTDRPLVNACRLCPNSPTYWRSQPTRTSVEPASQSAVCLTCKEPTSNRDQAGLARCESCCAWLAVDRKDQP